VESRTQTPPKVYDAAADQNAWAFDEWAKRIGRHVGLDVL
jgi:hypothetical protein